MHSLALCTLFLAGLAAATLVPPASLEKRDSYDCKGSAMCSGAVNFLRDCDNAVNKDLVRTDGINYGSPGSGKPQGVRNGNCKVFIQGPGNCERSGNQIWNDYQDIRAHGCKKCGSKHWFNNNDECFTTIDYVA